MRIIPVMDLLGEKAVHAVRGERSHYLPITNRLTANGDPFALARAYREQFGLAELYVADLDAIQRRGSHAGLIARLAEESGLALMVDAGAADAEQARQVLALGARKVIFGAETAPDWDAVARVRAASQSGAVSAPKMTFRAPSARTCRACSASAAPASTISASPDSSARRAMSPAWLPRLWMASRSAT